MKVKYPPNVTVPFMELCDLLGAQSYPEWGPGVKETIAAQWALESGWGTSALAVKFKNYAGMKWRDLMAPVATPVSYMAHDGRERYCSFGTHQKFIDGYILRLDRLGPYDGWRAAAKKGGPEFIAFVGPIWLGLSKLENQEYIRKVNHLVETRFV